LTGLITPAARFRPIPELGDGLETQRQRLIAHVRLILGAKRMRLLPGVQKAGDGGVEQYSAHEPWSSLVRARRASRSRSTCRNNSSGSSFTGHSLLISSRSETPLMPCRSASSSRDSDFQNGIPSVLEGDSISDSSTMSVSTSR